MESNGREVTVHKENLEGVEFEPIKLGDKVCLNDIWYKVQRITRKDVVLRLLKRWEI